MEVLKNLKFHVEEEIRFRENATLFDRQIIDLGLSYRITRHVKAAFFYRIEADWKNADEYIWRSGMVGEATLRFTPKRFSLGYRIRLQTRKIELNEGQTSTYGGFKHRHKFTADYNIKGIPLTPFVECELFVDHQYGKGSELSGIRSWVGLGYSIAKNHDLSLKYGIDQEVNAEDPLRAYIIAIGYSLNLKAKSVK
jgi:hypothetical protein